MLKIDNLEVSYGNIKAIKGISLEVNEGEIVTLIGSNGAGKSTTLRAISGLLKPRSGSITFMGERIDGLEGHDVVKKGICHSPEGRRIFPRMTVEENLDLGALWRRNKKEAVESKQQVIELFPRLGERLTQRADTLSGGERQMLAIGRALMSKPQLLLLDEPSLGLAPLVIEQIFLTIRSIVDSTGLTVLLVEQNAMGALKIADTAVVLNLGSVAATGSAVDLMADPAVRSAYLGY